MCAGFLVSYKGLVKSHYFSCNISVIISVHDIRSSHLIEMTLYSLRTKLYTEDRIGLTTLNEAGKVKFISVSGNHLQFSRADMKKYIVPYLKNSQAPAPAQQMATESSSYKWIWTIKNLFIKLLGLSEDSTKIGNPQCCRRHYRRGPRITKLQNMSNNPSKKSISINVSLLV